MAVKWGKGVGEYGQIMGNITRFITTTPNPLKAMTG
jgi:hypothetical protein